MIPTHSQRWRDRLLVAGAVGLQVVLLAVGWMLTFNHLHRRVSSGVEEFILRSNAEYANGLAEALGRVGGGIDIGSPEWERVQSVVESVELPGAGFACLLNQDGYIIAHSDFRSDPTLGKTTLAGHRFVQTSDGRELGLFEVEADRLVAGTMAFSATGSTT